MYQSACFLVFLAASAHAAEFTTPSGASYIRHDEKLTHQEAADKCSSFGAEYSLPYMGKQKHYKNVASAMDGMGNGPFTEYWVGGKTDVPALVGAFTVDQINQDGGYCPIVSRFDAESHYYATKKCQEKCGFVCFKKAPSGGSGGKEPQPKPSGEKGYTITIKTRRVQYGGTDGDIHIDLNGSDESSATGIFLDDKSRNDFEQGQEDDFDRTAADVGSLESITLHNSGNDGWNVEWVEVYDKSTCGTYRFTCLVASECWVDGDETNTPSLTLSIGPEYMGCYIDEIDNRDMEMRILADGGEVYHKDLTVQKCVTACRDQGYGFAALQFSKSCWCGNSYGYFGPADESECNMKCTGAKTEICGGADRNSVYSTAGYSPVDPTTRVECGWAGISQETCLARDGCCFDNSIRDVKWCFKRPNTGDCGGDGFELIQGGCYKFIAEKEFWAGAKEKCEGLDAYVLNIDSEQEQETLYAKFKEWTNGMYIKDEKVWIGATREDAQSPWVWDGTDSEITYDNTLPCWSSGASNCWKRTNLAMQLSDGKWIFVFKQWEERTRPFVCERNPQ